MHSEREKFLSAAAALRQTLTSLRDNIDVEIAAVDFLINGSARLSQAHLVALAGQYRNAVAMQATDRTLH